MTIRLRILALLALLGLFCVGTTWYFKHLHESEDSFARQQRVKAMSSRLQRLVSSVSRPAYRYLQDYCGRGGTVDFLASRDPAWAEKNIKGMMDLYRVDSVWVLNAGGAVIYGLDRATDSALAAPPLPPDELRTVLQKNEPFSFHAFLGSKLHQIQGMPVMASPASDGQTAPAGWLIVAKHWDELVLQDLADSAQGHVALTGPAHASDALAEELEVWLPLRDQHGRPIAGLDYHVMDVMGEDPAMEDIELSLFIFNGAGALVLVSVLMHFWILRPFSLVRASLVSRDPALLAPLLNQHNEFGQMARLVRSSMHDRDQLQQLLEERMRLGLELHDGVIQSVYGTGMALSRVQSLMSRDLPAAQKLLDETRAELNRIILELRRQIEQADPKPLDTTFGEAVTRLIEQFQGQGTVTTDLDIDENLVASHALAHRSQALQFVREAISNALRHGHPSRLSVSWQRTSGGSVLQIGDDGVGFDPKAVAAGGRGLGNLGERAVSLGGRLEIDSRPNHGTTVALKLPIPKSTA